MCCVKCVLSISWGTDVAHVCYVLLRKEQPGPPNGLICHSISTSHTHSLTQPRIHEDTHKKKPSNDQGGGKWVEESIQSQCGSISEVLLTKMKLRLIHFHVPPPLAPPSQPTTFYPHFLALSGLIEPVTQAGVRLAHVILWDWRNFSKYAFASIKVPSV